MDGAWLAASSTIRNPAFRTPVAANQSQQWGSGSELAVARPSQRNSMGPLADAAPVQTNPGTNSTEQIQIWAQAFEDHVAHQSAESNIQLPPQWRGRTRRLGPSLSKPSRQGEVTLQHDVVGTAVRQWYKQLRRLQSLQHAIKAGKQETQAILYRAETWAAILRAPGFSPNFREWWKHIPKTSEDSLQELPIPQPTEENIGNIYQEFNAQFRKFESWHNNQRLNKDIGGFSRTCEPGTKTPLMFSGETIVMRSLTSTLRTASSHTLVHCRQTRQLASKPTCLHS